MRNLQVYIDGKEADYLKRDSIGFRLVKNYTTANELDTRQSDYTLGLELPRTANNEKLFEGIGSVHLDGGFFKARSYACTLLLDSVEILSGRLLVSAVKPRTYTCTVVAANASWQLLVEGLTLRDIQSLGTIEFSGTRTGYGLFDLQTIWNTDEADGLKIQFPLISYGNFPADPDSTELNPFNGVLETRDSYGLIDGAVFQNTAAWPISPFRFTPCGYVKTLVRAIFTDLGYTTGGDFFTQAKFDNLLLPFTDSQGGTPPLKAGASFPVKLDARPGVPVNGVLALTQDNNFIVTYLCYTRNGDPFAQYLYRTIVRFIAPQDGNYTWSFEVQAGDAANTNDSVVIEVNGITVVNELIGDSATKSYAIEIAADANEEVEIQIDCFSFTSTTDTLVLTSDINEGTGETEIASLMPDILQADFVKGIVKLFNLDIQIDDATKNVTIQERGTAALDSAPIDWTAKANLLSADVTPGNGFKEYLLTWQRENDELLYSTGLYDIRVTSGSEYYRDVFEFDNLFAATGERQYKTPRGGDGVKDIPLVTIGNAGDFDEVLKDVGSWDYNKIPRLLKWVGLVNYTAADGLFVGSVEATTCVMSDTDVVFDIDYATEYGGPNIPIPTARFVNSGDSFILDFNGATGLYNQFWADTIAQQLGSSIFQLDVMLTPADVYRLAPGQRVLIDNAMFVILSLDDFNP